MPTLEITTIVGCPMQCTFCPQDKLVKGYPADAPRALSLDNFKAVLAKVPKHVRVDFSGMAEPWMNAAATEMLAHALKSDRHVAVYTTLQGMREPDRVARLLSRHLAQVEAVVVHLPDADGNMRGFRDGSSYRNALAIFQALAPDFGGRLQFMTMGDVPYAGAADMPWFPNDRAGNLKAAQGRASTPVTCSYTPFYDQNVLLPNGDVVLCCMDYSLQHKLGNLFTQDYYELFSSEGMGALIAQNMRYGCESLCASCDRARTHDLGSDRHFWTWGA